MMNAKRSTVESVQHAYVFFVFFFFFFFFAREFGGGICNGDGNCDGNRNRDRDSTSQEGGRMIFGVANMEYLSWMVWRFDSLCSVLGGYVYDSATIIEGWGTWLCPLHVTIMTVTLTLI